MTDTLRFDSMTGGVVSVLLPSWYKTEYLQTTGSFNWNTRVGSFKCPGCQ